MYEVNGSTYGTIPCCLVRTVILNRGAAEHFGAMESSRGAAGTVQTISELGIYLLVNCSWGLGVPQNCSLIKEGCRESKNVEKHWVRV